MFIQRRKKRFDEEGDEDLPPKNRPFKLKNAEPEPPPQPPPRPTPPQPPPRPTPPPKPPKPAPQPTPVPKPLAMLSDEEGLDRAYASDTDLYLDEAGTLFVSGTKGGLGLLGKERRIARYNAGFNEVKTTDRPGGFDPGYKMPFNQTPMTQSKSIGTTISAS